MKSYDSIVIGSGAAGLSASIYLSRAKFKTLVIGKTKESQLMQAYEVENYFGFPEGITGKKLIKLGIKQAKKSGAELKEDSVLNIEKKGEEFIVSLSSKEVFTSKTLIIATGTASSLNFIDKLALKKVDGLISSDAECKTNIPGVFAAGNCTTKIKQIANDVGEGCAAAISAIKFIKKVDVYLDYGPMKK